MVDVVHAVADVSSVLSHAEKGEISDRAGFVIALAVARRHTNLNNRPFVDVHVFQGLEHPIFVLCSNGRILASEAPSQADEGGRPPASLLAASCRVPYRESLTPSPQPRAPSAESRTTKRYLERVKKSVLQSLAPFIFSGLDCG